MVYLSPLTGPLVLLLTLAFPLMSFGETSDCESALHGALSPSQSQALKEAAEQDFSVTVLKRDDGEHKKTVILLGESHLKDEASSSAGKKLLREFSFRGVEGFIANDAIAKAFSATYLKLAYGIHKLVGRDKRSHQSTIFDAFEGRAQAQIGKALDELVQEGKFTREELASLQIEVEGKSIAVGDFLKGLGTEVTRSAPPINLHLEADHKRGLLEKSKMVLDPAVGLVVVTNIVVLAVKYATGVEVIPFSIILSANVIVLTPTLVSFHGSALLKRYRKQSWYRKIFAFESALIDSRNNTMSKNISKALIDHPERDQLLVIVGKRHVEGLVELLESEGFVAESL